MQSVNKSQWYRERKQRLLLFISPVLHREWPNWRVVRIWGNNRYAKSAYIWLVVVPLAAKLMSPLSGTYLIPLVGGKTKAIEIGLPFSWKVFFLAALFISIAQIIFQTRCPEIIKDYVTFGDYRARHAGNRKLCEWAKLICAAAGSYTQEKIERHIKGFGPAIVDEVDRTHPEKRGLILWRLLYVDSALGEVDKDLNPEAERSNTFEALTDWASRQNFGFSMAAFCLYAIGTLLFLWVALQNIFFALGIVFS